MASSPNDYKKRVLDLSKKYLDVQSDLSLLSDVNWKPTVKQKFEKLGFKSLPEITLDDYEGREIDYGKKLQELQGFIEEANKVLGPDDPIAKMLVRNTKAWILTVQLLQTRGTPKFIEISRRLYGSSEDMCCGVKLIDAAIQLDKWLAKLAERRRNAGVTEEKVVPSDVMVKELSKRLKKFFGKEIPIRENPTMSSDADAGTGGINIRKGAMFRLKDIGVFEVHEGWVHIGSALNGLAQPYMKFLGEACPGTDTIQEGLAALTEVITMKSYPIRTRKIVDRVIAINMAEKGANFLEVYKWYLDRNGRDEASAFVDTSRVFHGGTIEGGNPLTRDIIYLKGVIMVLKFIDMCIQRDKLELIPFLFDGNLRLQDVPVLYSLAKQGICKPPKYVPYHFREGIDSLMIFLTHFSFIKNKLKG